MIEDSPDNTAPSGTKMWANTTVPEDLPVGSPPAANQTQLDTTQTNLTANAPESRQRTIVKSLVGVAVCLVVLGLVAWGGARALVGIFHGDSPSRTTSGSQSNGQDKAGTFPNLDRATFSPSQNQLAILLATDFEAQPDGTSFAEGAEEPWCADFVSSVFHEIGHPFTNPVTDGWRIPGVETLQNYLREAGAWLSPINPAQFGDIVIYASDSLFGQHTNIVLQATDTTITTIGGNEGDQIRITTHDLDDPELRIVGFGRIDLG